MVTVRGTIDGTTWYQWCTSASTTATSVAYSDDAWYTWNGVVTSGTSNTTSVTWSKWVTVKGSKYTPINETEEQKQQRLERQRIQQEEYQARQAEIKQQQEERERQRKEADDKADTLLKSFLTAEQLEQLDKLNCIIVTTPKGNTYKIERANVKELTPEGKAKADFCIHPDYSLWLPSGDSMLAKMLMLETDEAKFLKIANKRLLAA